MSSDPVQAGRKGGSRNTPAQQAARRANGFQKRAQASEQPADLQPGCGCVIPPSAPSAPAPQSGVPAVLISQPKEGQ
jgi:hypothetical protein